MVFSVERGCYPNYGHLFLEKVVSIHQKLARLSTSCLRLTPIPHSGVAQPDQPSDDHGDPQRDPGGEAQSRVDTFTRVDSVVTVYVQVKHVSCTADNGVGEAAEAAKVVTVRRPPVVTAPMLTSVTVDNVDIV